MQRDIDDIIFLAPNKQINCGTFLGQVAELAESLPEAPVAINLCENRHAFILGFFAAIVRGQANHLPPSRRPGVIREAIADCQDGYVLHDGAFDGAGVRHINIDEFRHSEAFSTEVPVIPDNQLAAVVHTSGSTGASTRLKKYWRTFSRGIEIDVNYVREKSAAPIGVVATVPPWHMYGIELTVLLPTISNTAVCTGESLFPEDIRSALERIPFRRILVSTPVHLRAIVRAQLDFPPVERILCATAPLSLSMAQDVEKTFSGRVLDLYGCSEIGLLGYRWLTERPEWNFFRELGVAHSDEKVTISADHLPDSVLLSDAVEILQDGRFNILGRSEELVKIGGKRASLAEMTHRLLTIDGVRDGVIFRPSSAGDDSEVRLLAFVVSPGRTVEEIRAALAEVIDPVFIPRPIRLVDKLPRSRTGKLRRADLEKIAGMHSS